MGTTILVVGSTGNTGKEVVRTLSTLLRRSGTRIIATTRTLDSNVVRELSGYEGVEFQAVDWTDIDTDWLKERGVNKAFIAPQNGSSQFADESAFHLALLQAGVDPIWYGRNHWAIQTLLNAPEFDKLAFTSLCPNTFTVTYLSTAAHWVKEYKKSGHQVPLKLPLDASAKVAMIDPNDVGKVAGHLLALNDFSAHNGKAYILAGPEDVTGNEIVELIEYAAGVKVEKVEFRNTEFLEDLGTQGIIPFKFVRSMISGMGGLWDGSSSLAKVDTDQAIKALAPPSSTVRDAFQAMLSA